MTRGLFPPIPTIGNVSTVVGVEKGGTSGTTPKTAADGINGVSKDTIGWPLGPIPLDGNKLIHPRFFNLTEQDSNYILIEGPSSIYGGTPTTYRIVNYDTEAVYNVSTTYGTVTINDDIITYTPSNTPGTGGFNINNQSHSVSIGILTISAPNITAPFNGSETYSTSMSFTSSDFLVVQGTDIHVNSDWELATDSNFANIVHSETLSTVHKISWSVSNLTNGTQYFARVRYRGATFGQTAWSPVVVFTVKSIAIQTPTILVPVNNAVNRPVPLTITASSFNVNGGADAHNSSDWQISTNVNFSSIAKEVTGNTTFKTEWAVEDLAANTAYYVRVRYKGDNLPYSGWSLPSKFTTASASVNKPTITHPTNGSTNNAQPLTATSSSFAVTGGTDTHASSNWQVATDSNFNNIILNNLGDQINKISWTVTSLLPNTLYYLRVQHVGANYNSSDWSNVISFRTLGGGVNVPVITQPSNNFVTQQSELDIVSSAFYSSGYTDSHQSSDWQLSLNSSFTSIVSSVSDSVSNKTTWRITNLTPGTTYYLRVRHRGVVLGYSAWSQTITVVTGASMTSGTITSNTSVTIPVGATKIVLNGRGGAGGMNTTTVTNLVGYRWVKNGSPVTISLSYPSNYSVTNTANVPPTGLNQTAVLETMINLQWVNYPVSPSPRNLNHTLRTTWEKSGNPTSEGEMNYGPETWADRYAWHSPSIPTTTTGTLAEFNNYKITYPDAYLTGRYVNMQSKRAAYGSKTSQKYSSEGIYQTTTQQQPYRGSSVVVSIPSLNKTYEFPGGNGGQASVYNYNITLPGTGSVVMNISGYSSTSNITYTIS